MIPRNVYRFQFLAPGQLSWGAQIEACLLAFARQQGHQRPLLYEGPVEPSGGTLLAYGFTHKLVRASAAADDSLARPVGFMAGALSPPQTVTVECMGHMGAIKKEVGLVWPAAGEVGYLSATTPGAVTDTPPTGGTTVQVPLGIFLDDPAFLYLPHLRTL